MIPEINGSFTAAIGRSVNSPLMMKPYNEFSCDKHKKKGDGALRQFCSLNAKRAYKWVERTGRL